MPQFAKHFRTLFVWLILSEILCLVLSFSFAIIGKNWMQYISLACSLAVHLLLMASTAQKIANASLIQYRRTKYRISILFPSFLGLLTAAVQEIPYGLLWIFPNSVAYRNIFPILQSPFLQIQKMIFGDAETFAELLPLIKFLSALPPIFTALTVIFSFEIRYRNGVATEDAKGNTESSREKFTH